MFLRRTRKRGERKGDEEKSGSHSGPLGWAWSLVFVHGHPVCGLRKEKQQGNKTRSCWKLFLILDGNSVFLLQAQGNPMPILKGKLLILKISSMGKSPFPSLSPDERGLRYSGCLWQLQGVLFTIAHPCAKNEC